MEKLFKLPINKILSDEKNDYVSYHYLYYSGIGTKYKPGKYAIGISHIKNSNQHFLYLHIDDNVKDTSKQYKLRSITKNALNKLQEQIDKYLTKKSVNEKFINSWQHLINESKTRLENSLVIEINEGEVTTKSGKYPIYPWQKNKTIEEINESLTNEHMKTINSYEQYIIREDVE